MSAAADFDRTLSIQRAVSAPDSSAWVVANAGSGKTHVLTQRVLRLLLAGTDPAAILCLTFTRIAAAQMSRRVFDALALWATLPAHELANAIAALHGEAPTAAELQAARRLFARALETPGGLKIQTIHAFCERLLHQFPFEANVPGQFTVLDDSAAAALIASARAKVMNNAAADPRLASCMRTLASRAGDAQIGEALDAVIAKRDALRRWIDRSAARDIGGALLDLRPRLGLRRDETVADVCREICEAAGTKPWARLSCRELADALAGTAGNRADGVAGAALRSIAAAEDASIEADLRIDFFLAEDKGSDWKCRSASHRFSAAFHRGNRGLKEAFEEEAERLLPLARRLAAARAVEDTTALLVVGEAILQAYHAAKRRAGALDFSDLIAKTRTLLSRADAADWVLYKLDRRVEHILVDEAQDTSPDQWSVVEAIARDFFSGESASQKPRTIFAVGDDKQSIFGFQGAAPRMLAEMQDFFARKASEAKMPFVARPLFLSFRSTREVLGAVDGVFKGDLAGMVTASSYEAHASRRDQEPGHVVLLPRVVRQKAVEPEDWTEPYDAPSAAETELAGRIADEIARLSGTVLPSGKRVRDGEILVLVRRRDAFFAAMNRALRARRIPTAGADRIPIATHIAVLDLLALADVMLLPDDDLQLASCLKSPLLGLGEDDLMRLAIGRERSLWSALGEAVGEPARGAAGKLRRWRSMADQMTPFRFFATILGPEGGRRAFRARLGSEADDVLDAFLSQALTYEAGEAPSLQGFLGFVRANESDIKREAEASAAGVRVMTVHGAKGLEADVVFLVDTGGLIVVPGQRDLLVSIGRGRDDPAFLWRRRKEEAPEIQRQADQAADAETEREYLRLLYVAMTRARDVLYVAGIRGERTPTGCWYSRIADALVPDSVERDDGELTAPYLWPQPARPAKAALDEEPVGRAGPAAAPDWLSTAAPLPPPAPEPLRPSSALGEPDWFRPAGPAAGDALAADGALLRGRLLHLLLQTLPGLPPAARRPAAERLLAGSLGEYPGLADSIRTEAEAVLALPALEAAFGEKSRPEAAIVGEIATASGAYAVSGRIDRLVRDAAGWHLFDFKTDRAVPAAHADIPEAHVLQLALYRRLLVEIEPGTRVATTLVYTAGPNVFPIPPERMEPALEKLGIEAKPFP